MKKVLSKYMVYIFLFSLLYLIQRFIFINILDLKPVLMFNGLCLHEVVFLISSFCIVKYCFKIEYLD